VFSASPVLLLSSFFLCFNKIFVIHFFFMLFSSTLFLLENCVRV
jgi:hypothetical protein